MRSCYCLKTQQCRWTESQVNNTLDLSSRHISRWLLFAAATSPQVICVLLRGDIVWPTTKASSMAVMRATFHPYCVNLVISTNRNILCQLHPAFDTQMSLDVHHQGVSIQYHLSRKVQILLHRGCKQQKTKCCIASTGSL